MKVKTMLEGDVEVLEEKMDDVSIQWVELTKQWVIDVLSSLLGCRDHKRTRLLG